MPYPNEHAARIADPGKFKKFRRQNGKFGEGIDAIFGIREDGKAELQAVRFNADKFTQDQVRKWLADHNMKPVSVESATEKQFTSAMVALFINPAAANALSVPDGELPENMHITLIYLGSMEGLDKNEIISRLNEFAKYTDPIIGRINGMTRFHDCDGPGVDAAVYLFDSPTIPMVREELRSRLGIDPRAQTHGFIPHITVKYLPESEPISEVRYTAPMIFTDIVLAWGDERISFPLNGLNRYKENDDQSGSLMIFKDTSGDMRWVAFSSNAFRDLDGEIVSQKALQDDVDRSDEQGNYGPLRWWHIGDTEKGLDIGKCDYRAVIGRTLVESGTFYDPEVAEQIAQSAGALQLSLGFWHPSSEPDASGVYHNIATFERSLVPRGRAANPFTRLSVQEVQSGESQG